MPMSWVEPEVFVEHKGLTVYHAYKDDTDQRLEYSYQTDLGEDSEYEFNVMDLPCYDDELSHEEIIKKAIDDGILVFP